MCQLNSRILNSYCKCSYGLPAAKPAVYPQNVLKQEVALSTLHFNFALGYAIRSFQVNQDGLILNDTH